MAGSEERAGQYAIDEFTPEGETAENWAHMFTLMNLVRRPSLPDSPEAMMDGFRAKMQTHCPRVHWSVLRRSGTDVLYERQVSDCPGETDQVEIARILYGGQNVWRLSYTEKTRTLAAETRERWIRWLSEPEVVPQPSHHRSGSFPSCR